MGKNYQHVFGIGRMQLFNSQHINEYFDNVHENDQDDLQQCFAFLYDRLKSIPPEEHANYRSVFHYRFKKKDGQYIYLHDEKAVLHLAGAGNLYYALLRDTGLEKLFQGVKVELFRQDQALQKIEEHQPSADRKRLSKREGELLHLFRQGLSTKEIAWSLAISHHTVRNIKSRLFEKFNVSNTIELLNMTA